LFNTSTWDWSKRFINMVYISYCSRGINVKYETNKQNICTIAMQWYETSNILTKVNYIKMRVSWYFAREIILLSTYTLVIHTVAKILY
jgi:hypothetical protein